MAAPRSSTAATFIRASRSSHEVAWTIWARPASASFRAVTTSCANSSFEAPPPHPASSSTETRIGMNIETGRNTRP